MSWVKGWDGWVTSSCKGINAQLFSLATEHPKELAIVADQFYFLLQPQRDRY